MKKMIMNSLGSITEFECEEEMTLRDYFAAKALQGMLARERPTNPKAYAQNSYEIADAMMEARNAAQ